MSSTHGVEVTRDGCVAPRSAACRDLDRYVVFGDLTWSWDRESREPAPDGSRTVRHRTRNGEGLIRRVMKVPREGSRRGGVLRRHAEFRHD